jgi:tetratricopeptide (TPR) repeat protein
MPTYVFFALVFLWQQTWAYAETMHPIHTLVHEWSLEKAVVQAEQALWSEPKNPLVWSAAGSVLFSLGQADNAAKMLQDAEKEGAYIDQDMLERAMAVRVYEQQYQHIETKHFKIRYISKDIVTARYATEVAEKAYANISRALDYNPPSSSFKTIIDIVPNAKALADSTGLTVQEIATSGTIAVCKYHKLMITSPLAVSHGYDWADTLSHEMTHFFISKKSKNKTPIWLHEGIAKYVESVWKGPAGKNISPYGEKLLAKATQKKTWIPFSAMHPSMAKLPSQDDTSLAFAEVFSVIEFLEKEHGVHVVPDILKDLGEGLSVEQALSKNVQMTLSVLEKKWQNSLDQRAFTFHSNAKPTRISLLEQGEETLSKTPFTIQDVQIEKTLRLGELLQLRGHIAEALEKYTQAHALSKHMYPEVTYALAKAYTENKQHTHAITLLQEAAKHPIEDHTELMLLIGSIYLKQKQWTEAQHTYESLRYKNPYNPALHKALEEIYAAQKMTAEATQEKDLLEWCNKKRPALKSIQGAASKPTDGFLTIIPKQWETITLNDQDTLYSPLWKYPLTPGPYTLKTARGKNHTVVVKPQKNEVFSIP